MCRRAVKHQHNQPTNRIMKYMSVTHVYFIGLIFVSHWTNIIFNSIQDTRQNYCTMKYKSLTYIYYIFSLCHWINIPSTTFSLQIVKIWQNHWTMKCRSLTHKTRLLYAPTGLELGHVIKDADIGVVWFNELEETCALWRNWQATFTLSHEDKNSHHILASFKNSVSILCLGSKKNIVQVDGKMKVKYMSHAMRKPVYGICEQQRRRSACASAQSDQQPAHPRSLISTFLVPYLDMV